MTQHNSKHHRSHLMCGVGLGILPRLWAYSTRKVFPQVPPQHSQFSVLYRSIFDSPVFVFCRSIFSLKFVIIALLPRKTFTGKHTANHIHPASRGVAAHTAGWEGLRVVWNFHFPPPWGLPKLGNFRFLPPVGASQAREFSLFPREASQAKNFHFPPPWGLPKLGNFHFSPPWGLPKLGNFHFSPPWQLPKLWNFHFSLPWRLSKLRNFK